MVVLFLTNSDIGLINFRKEIIIEMMNEGHEVHVSCPYGDSIDLMIKKGIIFQDINLDRRGTSIKNDYKLYREYKRLIKNVNPNIVFSYTIKPNIYGGIACSKMNIPFVPNITGLGSAFYKKGLIHFLIKFLLRKSLKNAKAVFFQNKYNLDYFNKHILKVKNAILLPGSGVNVLEHKFENIEHKDKIIFTFIGRVMKEKGIEEYLEAAEYISKKFVNVLFKIAGFIEDEKYKNIIDKLEEKRYVEYLGFVSNTHDLIKESDCIVLPSYHEGMSNVLLEAQSTGRPVIASNIPGCIETFENNVTGYAIEVKNTKDLIDKIELFLNLDFNAKIEMGLKGRKRVETYFDRRKVVEEYLKLIRENEK